MTAAPRNPPLDPHGPMESLAPLAAGLLVGGASRRYGRDKALEPVAGSTFAERVAAALYAVTPELVLLGAGAVPAALADLPRLADAPDARGPLAGVLAALRARPDRAWVVAACDQPDLDRAVLEWLAAARSGQAIAVLPRLGARGVEPFPGIYEPAALAVLEALARDHGSSLQPLARRADVLTPAPPPELAGRLLDVDRPGDLERPRTPR